MKISSLLPTLAAGAVLFAWADDAFAQGSAPARIPTSTTSAGASSARPAAVRSKGPLPDPAIFNGKDLPAEARPDKGMLAEFELPGSVARPDAESKSQGSQGQGQMPGLGVGLSIGDSSSQGQSAGVGAGLSIGDKQGQGAGGIGAGISVGDSQAEAAGIAVGKLDVNENSAKQNELPPKPRDVSMGDRSQQIPAATAQQNVIGAQPPPSSGQRGSNSQGYEKGSASGSSPSGSNQNKGLEKGRVVPEGL